MAKAPFRIEGDVRSQLEGSPIKDGGFSHPRPRPLTPSPIRRSCSGLPCGSVSPSVIVTMTAAHGALSGVTCTCSDAPLPLSGALPGEQMLVARKCLHNG